MIQTACTSTKDGDLQRELREFDSQFEIITRIFTPNSVRFIA